MNVTAGSAPFDEKEVLSPGWLAGMLSTRYPGAVPMRVEVVERIETVATKLRFRLEYAEDTDAPTALCAKGYFNPALRRATRAEADFYRLAADQLPVRTPPWLHAAVDDESGHPLIVLHDLVARGARFLDPLVGYTAEEAAATLDQLAALHAATRDGEHAAWRKLFPPRLTGLTRVLGREALQRLLDDGRAAGVPAQVRDADRLTAAMTAMEALSAEHPSCLIHGDLHAGNIYQLADGSPGLIDWQVVQFGNWAQDVGYHLATVLDPDELARNERNLVAHYLDRLAAHGGTAPGWDQAWWLYRAYLPYGLFLWSITRAVDRPIIEHLAGRLARAVARHGSLDLLDV
ncbi:phosphotransferase [Nocardia sp. NPDC019395]|uniref:phosphotransferase n=1 Tax=Nocardia sp. NPDC019395 TaxID=3154686 RepID=UPI0033D642D4